jgi:hypothetical protein
MKNSHFVILVILIFSFASGASADKGVTKHKPESILTCIANNGVGPYSVWSPSIPSEISTDQCRTREIVQPPDSCSACIGSLEAQGCKIIDVDVVQVDVDDPATVGGATKVTYLLSCSKP